MKTGRRKGWGGGLLGGAGAAITSLLSRLGAGAVGSAVAGGAGRGLQGPARNAEGGVRVRLI